MKKLLIPLLLAFVLIWGVACQGEEPVQEETPDTTEETLQEDLADDQEYLSEETSTDDHDVTTDEQAEDTQDDHPVVVDTATGLAGAEGAFPLTDAVDLFDDQFPDALLTKIQLDKDDSVYVYKIEGTAEGMEYELKVNAATGDIVELETDDEDDDDQTFAYEDAIPIAEAYDILMNNVAADEWILDEWELDYDFDKLVYDFELDHVSDGRDLEVKIDALNGEIVEIDQ